MFLDTQKVTDYSEACDHLKYTVACVWGSEEPNVLELKAACHDKMLSHSKTSALEGMNDSSAAVIKRGS